MMSHRWMKCALLSLLAMSTPALAQEATPQSAPFNPAEGAPAVEQPSSLPSADGAAPVAAEPAPVPTAPPVETVKVGEEGPKRRHGYLAVFGVASLVAGVASFIMAGASLLNPYVVQAGFSVFQHNGEGIALPFLGASVNPFYLMGGAMLVLGVGFAAAGFTMLGLEVYFNGSF